MPSDPTTLAELVARLEVEAARERYLGSYGDSADLMERAAKVLRAVDELHKPYGIYDDCGHDHESTEEPGVVDAGEDGLSCSKLYDICESCCIDLESRTKRCVTEHDHGLDKPICPTTRALGGSDAG